MKRVRCPQCHHPITFDETQYEPGQPIVFRCQQCGKQFGIRNVQRAPQGEAEEPDAKCEVQGSILVVIENKFHYKQELPLQMGDNTIGRYQKANNITTPIHTDDPSVDLLHCIVNVSRDKQGRLRYTLRDANSNTGTFVDNTELAPRERRVIEDGTLFTIGATSILLKV